MRSAEWLYEEGIGENRAILVEDDEILVAAIELPGEMRCGAVLAGRLVDIPIAGRRGIVATAQGEVMVEPLPGGVTQGRRVRVEIVREPIAEPGKPKYARGRITDAEEREGPSLAQSIGAAARPAPPGPDRFEEAGWSELIDEAISGEIDFPGGALRMSLTPAMTLFDVDGFLPPAELAVAGAEAAALAIRRLGIGGSIGIDLPTIPSRADRLRAVAALDSALPRPFERTAVNGFGFLQVVRRRERRSLPELLQWDPVGGAARDLLRRAEWEAGLGPREIVAAPAVVARLRANPAWIETLAQRVGGAVALREEPAFTTWGGHVHARLS
ncbi:MAG: ribonuclease [Alphaproteobacteria bacterium]|nr:ribonuclease [Alphaproteobacteria bacterium]MBV9373084.1 ribonuclease [Alphaproteobacteria bacterium]MBV9902886.1 ribonuclease [Alphaproteobacteria bacterium]